MRHSVLKVQLAYAYSNDLDATSIIVPRLHGRLQVHCMYGIYIFDFRPVDLKITIRTPASVAGPSGPSGPSTALDLALAPALASPAPTRHSLYFSYIPILLL